MDTNVAWFPGQWAILRFMISFVSIRVNCGVDFVASFN